MANANLQALQNFRKKLNSYKSMGSITSTLAHRIADKGMEIAQEEYADRKVDISKEEIEPGRVRVVAKGKGLAFDEFGTGLVGKGTYGGKLPTETIEFESPKGSPQSTQGWEYYYNNPKTKVDGGWYAGKVFHRGQPAKAQMFNTSLKLRDEMSKIAKELIKENVDNE